MVRLSAQKINEISPYAVYPTDDDGFVSFITDIYLCETGDEKQLMRSRLFQYWASTSEIKDEVTILSTCITDEEGIKNYAALILRVDHPYYNEVLADFNRTVKLLNSKPA